MQSLKSLFNTSLDPHQRKRLLIISGVGFAFIFLTWVATLYMQVTESVQGEWFLPPLEIYSAPQHVQMNQKVSAPALVSQFKKWGWRERASDQKLLPGDYTSWSASQCDSFVDSDARDNLKSCLVFFTPENLKTTPSQIFLIALDSTNQVVDLLAGDPFSRIQEMILPPDLFAQFYGEEPIIRRLIGLSDAPLQCLQAITAIEDSRFLDHQGISLISIMRAALRNVSAGRFAEGGSTITQQLVKNYFLNAEKSFGRKLREVLMALMLETKFSKDEILSSYLNVIYMGQHGPFQIRGFGAAAEYYFGKKLETLELPECSLLAAIVNSPGRFNPFSHKETSLERRNLVLKRMVELNMIQQADADKALQSPWPEKPPKALSEPAPYYVDAVRKELQKIGYGDQTGLRVYTGLQVQAQEAAYQAARDGLTQLEKMPKIAKLKAENKHLEVSLLSVDPMTGAIISIVGGRSYRVTQFNRAIDAHRQVGSLIKPLVYLTALERETPEGKKYTPITMLKDEPIEMKSGDQVWKPKNYDHKVYGSIPMFYALRNSINLATANLALEVGLGNIIETARRCGIESPLDEVPSLALGAFEAYPMEILQCYSTIANLGLKRPVFIVDRIESFDGQNLYEHNAATENAFGADVSSVMISLLKQVVEAGTGISIPSWRGFTLPAAGKTGTTSDSKDAWFMGFTPHVMTLVWVGYDDNTSSELTGSSGAIPIWTQFMKNYATQYPPDDFAYAEDGVEKEHISEDDVRKMLPFLKEEEIKAADLIFLKGTGPSIFD